MQTKHQQQRHYAPSNCSPQLMKRDQYGQMPVDPQHALGKISSNVLLHPSTPYRLQRQIVEQLQRTQGNAFTSRYLHQLQHKCAACDQQERDPVSNKETPAERSLDNHLSIQPVASVATNLPHLMRQTTTTPGGPDPCFNLLQAIIELLNEVAKRFNDALNDPHELFKYHRTKGKAHPEFGSWDGHKDRYNYDRGRLRHKLAEWEIDERCRGYRLRNDEQADLEEAKEFSEKEFPLQPAPSMRETTKEPSLHEKVEKALIKIGVPAFAVGTLVGLIVVALADPEPFSKVSLLLGASAAVALFILLGRDDDLPSNKTTAAIEDNQAPQIA